LSSSCGIALIFDLDGNTKVEVNDKNMSMDFIFYLRLKYYKNKNIQCSTTATRFYQQERLRPIKILSKKKKAIHNIYIEIA